MNVPSALALAAGVLVATSVESATTVTLAFGSLPSAQGWVLSGYSAPCPLPETTLFSVASGVLHQDTLGCGGGVGSSNGAAAYVLENQIPNQPFEISARMRVTSETTFYGGNVSHTGLGFGAYANGEEYYITIGSGYIVGLDGLTGGELEGAVLSTAYNTSQYHLYQLTVIPGSGYSLSVDGNHIYSGAPYPASASINQLFFGDGSSRANASGDISFYQFQSPIPEPSVSVLLLGGITFLVLAWHFRGSTHSSLSTGKMRA